MLGTLRSRLTLLVLASAVPALIFAVIMAALFEGKNRAAIEDNLRETAGALTVAVDRELVASISTLRALATSDHLETGELGLFYEQARRALRTRDGWSTINVFDRTGQQVVNLLKPFGSPLPFSGQLPVIRSVLDTAPPPDLRSVRRPGVRGPIIGVAVLLMRGDSLEYMLGVGLDVRLLTRLLAEASLPPDSVATVIDRNGIIVARTRNIDQLLGTPATSELVARLPAPPSCRRERFRSSRAPPCRSFVSRRQRPCVYHGDHLGQMRQTHQYRRSARPAGARSRFT